MSQIHISDGQTDNILDVITAKHIIEDVHKQSLKDTLETFNFTTFANKRFSQYLEKRNRVIIPGEDGQYREFIMHKVIKDINRQAQVYARASYLELKKQAIIYPQTFTEQTASQMIGHATNDTEWRPGIVEIDNYRTFEVENHRNPFAFLKTIANEFDAELRFRVETDGNRITGRFVDLLERRGRWQGREVTFGKDLENIKRTEKTDNVYTALVGIGPEREDGTRLEVLVEDQDALERWGRRDENGVLQHLIGTYEPQSTRQDMTESELEQYTRTELNKRINATVEFEAGIVDLEHVPGLENKKIRFGDNIKIKYTGFNPPLYLEARIFEQERSIVDKSAKKVKLGDFTELTEQEVNNVWKELQAQIAKKIDDAQLRDYTYDKLTINDKDTTVLEEGKTFAELQASNALEDAKADAEQKANAAQTAAEEYALAKANLAEKEAEAYADGVVSDEEQARINQAKANLKEAKQHAETKASEAQSAAKAYTDAQLTNYVAATQYDSDMSDIQAQIDNQITSHFKNYAPTLSNEPASLWTTDSEKDKHVGDLFYDTDTGYSYRFAKNNGSYEWVQVRDEGINKALQDASEAQDTADSKRRVFVSQPTTPYDKGDLWDNNGAVFRSTVSKTSSATFSQSDWTKIGDVTNENTAKDTDNVDGRPSSDIEDKQGAQDKADNAESNAKEHADTVSGQALIDAQNYAVAQTVYDNKMTEIANDLSDKAGIKYVNGQLQLKQGEIPQQDTEPSNPNTGMLWLDTSQSPNVMKRYDGTNWVKASPTDASEVGSYTIAEVDNRLSNKVAVTTYNADMDGVVNDIQSNSTLIGQNENAIALKADSSRVDTLEGTVSDHSSELSVMSDEISSKVEADYVENSVDNVDTHLVFDGVDDYVETTFKGVGDKKPRTIEFVYNSSSDNSGRIVAWGIDNAGEKYHVRVDENVLRVEINGGNWFGKTNICDGKWHHCAVVLPDNSSNVMDHLLYVDGYIEDCTGESEEIITDTSTNMRIGYGSVSQGQNEERLLGSLKDIRIWNRALPETEIQANMNKELTGDEEGLVGYWKLNEGFGNSVYDSSVNNNNGSINGSTWKGIGTKSAELLDVTVQNQQTEITQNADAITSKAEQSELNTLTGRVSTAESEITQNANEISQRVTEQTFNGGISDAKSHADTQANNAETNAENYTQNYAEKKKVKSSTSPSDTDVLWIDTSQNPNVMKTYNGSSWVKATPTQAGEIGAETPSGAQSKADSAESSAKSHANTQASDAESNAKNYTDNEISPIDSRLSSAESEITQNADNITSKVEQTDFNTLEGRVDSAESTIQQQADQIQSRVTDSEARSIFTQEADSFTFDANQINFDGHVFGENATFEGELSAVTGTFGEVIAQDDSFYIEDSQTGTRNHAVFKENLLKDHSFESVKSGNSIEDGILFEAEGNTPNAWSGWVVNSGTPRLIDMYYEQGFRRSESIFGYKSLVANWSNYMMQRVPAQPNTQYSLSFYAKKINGYNAGTPRLSLVFLDIDRNELSDDKHNFSSSVTDQAKRYNRTVTTPSQTAYIEVRLLCTSSNDWVAIDGAEMVQSEHPGLYNPENSVAQLINGLTRARNIYTDDLNAKSIRTTGDISVGKSRIDTEGRFVNDSSFVTVRSVNDRVYLQGTGVRAVAPQSTSDWVDFGCRSLYENSTVENKQNIEPWDESVLEEFENMKLYQWNRHDKAKKEYGFVIGDGYTIPDKIVDDEQESISAYTHRSMNTKAIQELLGITNNHDERINYLEMENQQLKAEIENLKGAS